MADKGHSAEQIISKLREAEVLLAPGTKLPQICRGLGVTEQTYYRWRKECGGRRTDQAKRLTADPRLQRGSRAHPLPQHRRLGRLLGCLSQRRQAAFSVFGSVSAVSVRQRQDAGHLSDDIDQFTA
jgi:hypothetical protein